MSLSVSGHRNTLDQVIDSMHNGVPKHLGLIADSVYELEGAVADALELTPADVANIKARHPSSLRLQTLVWYLTHFFFYYFSSLDIIMIFAHRRTALGKWKRCHGSLATYTNLIAAFERAGHQDYGDIVRKVVTGKSN